MTATAPALAYALCEALFAASPEAVTDEGDSGQVMPVTTRGRRLRLVRHDTAAGRFYRLYPPDDELAIVTIDRDCEVPALVSAAFGDIYPE